MEKLLPHLRDVTSMADVTPFCLPESVFLHVTKPDSLPLGRVCFSGNRPGEFSVVRDEFLPVLELPKVKHKLGFMRILILRVGESSFPVSYVPKSRLVPEGHHPPPSLSPGTRTVGGGATSAWENP